MKRLTRQQAISLHCKNCIYDPMPGNGNWKQQVTTCTTTDCALYPYRPISSAKSKDVDLDIQLCPEAA